MDFADRLRHIAHRFQEIDARGVMDATFNSHGWDSDAQKRQAVHMSSNAVMEVADFEYGAILPPVVRWIFENGPTRSTTDDVKTAAGLAAMVVLGSPNDNEAYICWLDHLKQEGIGFELHGVFTSNNPDRQPSAEPRLIESELGRILHFCLVSAAYLRRLADQADREKLHLAEQPKRQEYAAHADSAAPPERLSIDHLKTQARDRATVQDKAPGSVDFETPEQKSNRRHAVVDPLLEQKGLNRHSWAQAAERDAGTVYKWLAGNTDFRADSRLVLAKLLDVDPDALK